MVPIQFRRNEMQNRSVEISRSGNLQIKVILGHDNVTYAEVKSVDLFGDTLIVGRGKARWNPIDHFNPEIGKQIALGRALEKFGRKNAAHWERQAISPGEYRFRLKREKGLVQIAEYLNQIQGAYKALENLSQQPTMAQEAEENVEEPLNTTSTNSTDAVEDLAEVENRNRAKLTGNLKEVISGKED